MIIKTIKDIKQLKDKRVLLRVDFNVPIKGEKVVDDFKLKKGLPTLEYLLKKKAKVILATHLGRPNGKVISSLSVKPIRDYLEKELKLKIKLFKLDELEKLAHLNNLSALTMIENTRFSFDEKNNSGVFAKELANLADLYIMDCFAVTHRNQASVVGPAKYLPTYAGPLLIKEIAGLSRVLIKPVKPLVAVIGGVKMETKIPVLENLLLKANYILLGGGISNTYLWAKGYKIGKSLVDKKYKKDILRYAKNKKMIWPIDFIIGTIDGKQHQVLDFDKKFKVVGNWAVLDIGPRTINLYSQYIKKAKTLVWNGAMGYFEKRPYRFGTQSIAHLFATRSKGVAFGVTGGGETIEMLRQLNLLSDIDLVSTGGGAMLEFLAGKKLPGIEIITKN